MAMSRVTLRIAGAAAVAVAAASTLAGCTSGNGGQPPGQADGAPTTAASTAAAPMITLNAVTGTGGATAGATATGGAANPADGTAACTGGQIRQSFTSGGAAAGHLGLILVFTNTSGSACSMNGYPGASVSDANGSHWNAAREMEGYMGGAGGFSSPPTVVLAPGGTASALLMWTDVDDPNATCHTTDYTELLTTTPNTQSTVTYHGTYSCENLQVTPVVQGSGGRTQ